MTDPRWAALDPIFRLHHANIDRLWNRWLELGDGRTNPSDVAWLDRVFVFHEETALR
jgi:tyrosinase